MTNPLDLGQIATIARTFQEEAEAARYPVLFSDAVTHPDQAPRAGCTRIVRGTGLVIATMRHGQLTAAEAAAIAEYRLHQYVLSGLYDAATVNQRGLRADPAMASLASRDVHVAVGDLRGHFLCYLCMQSPIDDTEAEQSKPSSSAYPLLRDADRALFPCESEYGQSIFGDHAAMGLLPVQSVRELTRLVRNRVIRTPVDSLAVVETILAIARVITDPQHGLEAIIGCAAPEVRRLLYRLGIPVMYAPDARIVGDNRSGAAGDVLLWTNDAHRPGRFWPFALAAIDVRLDQDYFDRLDAILALPPAEIVESLNEFYPKGLLRQPRYLADGEIHPGYHWTANALQDSTLE